MSITHVLQNATRLRTGIIVDNERTASNANARMVGVESTVMVRIYRPASLCLRAHDRLVCKTDDACAGFPLRGMPTDSDDSDRVGNMTCYKGGETVFNNHQACRVTSKYHLGCIRYCTDASQTARFWTCCPTAHRKLRSVATKTQNSVISSSGPLRWNRSTANLASASRGSSPVLARTLPTTTVSTSSANACPVVSFVARMAVSVRRLFVWAQPIH